MSRLEPQHHRALLDAEIGRMVDVDPADFGCEVAHLPGWTVHSVVGHVGWILRWVSLCLEATPNNAPSRAAVGEPPVGPEVGEWFRQAAHGFTAVLDQCDLSAPRPSWAGPQDGYWWLRRMAHEVAIHRWDVYTATGRPVPIDAVQALDGVDELLDVFVPARLQIETLDASGQTIHLHATDIEGGEWMLHLGPDGVRWEHGHAKGDVAARGPASDLLLMLWGRIPPERLEVFGDAGLLTRWQQAAVF